MILTGAIYICTETAFPSERLQQLLKNSDLAKTHSVNGDVIFVSHIATVVIKILHYYNWRITQYIDYTVNYTSIMNVKGRIGIVSATQGSSINECS